MKLALLIAALMAPVTAPATETAPAKVDVAADAPVPARPVFTPHEQHSRGSVTVGGRKIAYRSVAGTLIVHGKDWDDTTPLEAAASPPKKDAEENEREPEASMFYAAYFKDGAPAAARPVAFLFNGGPGSSTVWLHMGAFGPVRVQTVDVRHTPAAPYGVVNNEYSLLDASDLVFVDAPGTGFSRIAGKDKDKAFYGVDQDIDAFAQFITQFLTKFGRWNSPKFIIGESYGTTRAAGLALALQNRDVDLNGVVLISDILAWDLLPDDPQSNPGNDLPYVMTLPSYAATAWYHDRVAKADPSLQSFLARVERFATTDYLAALVKGNDLGDEERQRIAQQLAAYTGLSVPYLIKTNLRIQYGAFQKELLADREETVGTLDTRFRGATLDPISKVATYDPQSSAISAAYVAAFNSHVRGSLRYDPGIEFKSGIPIYESWDYRHKPPGGDRALIALPNVLPDLAVAMKQNPDLRVMVNGGYYDISTPYFAGIFELRHLPIPASLKGNIEYRFYESGHMPYLHPPSLKAIHDNVAEFIQRTSSH